jgi:hypothetical protein
MVIVCRPDVRNKEVEGKFMKIIVDCDLTIEDFLDFLYGMKNRKAITRLVR